MSKTTSGFTLLELLLVMAVIGILAAIGLMNFQAFRRSMALREAQLQVATSIERARGTSRRYSYYIQFKAELNVAGEYQFSNTAQSYVRDYENKTVTYPTVTSPAPITAALPQNIQISNVTTNNPVEFRMAGPFGRLQTAARITLCLKHTADPNLLARIDVLGVTGKVVTRGIQSNGATCP
jgi:type IV pilus assembly protein PilA